MSKNKVQSQLNEVNRIAFGTTIKGSIRSESDIRVDGTFEGEIFTKGKLVVGEGAHISGEVTARNCDVWGYLEGEILLREYFGLRKSGTFKGKIACQKIFIEDEGVFNGSCKIIGEKEFEEGAEKLANKD